MEFNNEIWVDIVGQEGRYQVSNMGRVKSLPYTRTIKGRNQYGDFKTIINKTKEYILRGEIDKDGYVRVNINRKHYFVHRLVLTHFGSNKKDEKEQCCHNNGNPQDNRIENLRWGTVKENASDRKIHGTEVFGESSKLSKIKEDIAKLIIRNLNKKELTRRDFCSKYNVSINIYKDIQRNKTWKHLNREE